MVVTRCMATTHRLTEKEKALLDHYALHHNGTQAGISAGYTKRSAPQMFQRLMKNQTAQEYLGKIQQQSRAMMAYNLTTAMAESLEVIQYAKEKGNAMAYFKAVEHRAKLSGLLIDRIQVEKVDIRSAIIEAEARLVELDLPHIDNSHRIIDQQTEVIDNPTNNS